jgi:nucleotide-binding universal stress UspA family protein
LTVYRRILVPTDGTPGSEKAVRNALEIATRFDAALYAVSVVEADGKRSLKKRSSRSELVETAEQALDDVRREVEPRGLEVTTRLLEGKPGEQILRFIDQHDIDLVVMGTHGRQGFDRYLLGSITERVVREADVPVLTVSLGSDRAAVTTAEHARTIARQALEAKGYEEIAVEEGAYNERSAWVVQAVADGTAINVHIERDTGYPHVVEIGEA